jgi:hypothetical protein
MARNFGRILARIWDDRDFLALEPGPQRLYCFLLSQSNLNHAGLLPMTLRKWAKKAKGLTPEMIRRDLAALDAARFVVMDEDSEEVLIRSFVRNDDVWKMPRVMGSMVSGALEIESHRLRRALLAEMDRIPLDELSNEASRTKNGPGPSIQFQVWEHIETLRNAFKDLDPEPDEGVNEPLPEGVTEGVTEPPIEPVTQGDAEGDRGYVRAHGDAHARTSPSPSPTPSPKKELSLNSPTQPPLLALVGSEPLASLAERPPDLFDEFWNAYPRHVGKAKAKGAFATKVKNGADPTAVVAAARSYAERCRTTKQDPQFIPHPTTWLNRESWGDDLEASLPLPQASNSGYQPYRNPEDHSGYYGAI